MQESSHDPARRPTIADLARAAGVSVSTVDRVLNGRDPVRPDTANRILQAAEAIGYHASFLLRQRLRADVPVKTLGFLLQQRSTAIYRLLGEALVATAEACPALRARPVVEFMDDLTPGAVADRLERLGARADAVAVVAADHPNVAAAIARLQGRGVPVVALLSDLTAQARAGYVGIDNRKAGRTAAWFMAGLAPPGPVAIMLGSHRYQCQEACEMGFRALLREQPRPFRVLEPIATLESEHYAYQATLDLLARTPDLVGLYVAGGGIEGVMRALAEEGAGARIVTIAHDLTEHTRAGLLNGVIRMVLSHPIPLLAARAVAMMSDSILGRPGDAREADGTVAFEIYTAENL